MKEKDICTIKTYKKYKNSTLLILFQVPFQITKHLIMHNRVDKLN